MLYFPHFKRTWTQTRDPDSLTLCWLFLTYLFIRFLLVKFLDPTPLFTFPLHTLFFSKLWTIITLILHPMTDSNALHYLSFNPYHWLWPPLSCHVWVFVVQHSRFPLNSPNWTTGALLVKKYSEETDQLGTFTLSSTVPGRPLTVLLFTILLPLPAGTADGSHFQRLSSQLPLPHNQSHLHYRDILENGGKDMFKISPCLSTAPSRFPKEIKRA